MIGAGKQGKDVEGSWRSGVGCQGTCEKEGDGDGRKKNMGNCKMEMEHMAILSVRDMEFCKNNPSTPPKSTLRNRLPTNNAPLPPL